MERHNDNLAFSALSLNGLHPRNHHLIVPNSCSSSENCQRCGEAELLARLRFLEIR